jgi:hypothetical protein
MKSPRTWFPVLALLVLALFGTPVAHAALYCGTICSCDVPCSTRCTEGGGLPILTCGQWYYELCREKPWCNIDVTSSPATASNTSSGKADPLLVSIFAPATSMTR